jgi:large subunit ribosomal protein L4
MSTAAFVDASGKTTGAVQLPDDIFDIEPNVPVMHAVVKAHLAAIRAGTHSTKTRAEVRGGGKKPWRQKGTGRARHGSTREPQWVGGGVAHGPQPRDYAFSLTKKTRALALRSALSDRAREGSIVVVELPPFDEPKTRRAKELLETWGAKGKVLLVVGRDADGADELADTWKSFRNLPNVLVAQVPTTYKVLAAEVVVITKAALAEITGAQATVGPPAAAPEAPVAPPAVETEDEAEEEVVAEAEEIVEEAEADEDAEEEAVVAEAEEIVEEAEADPGADAAAGPEAADDAANEAADDEGSEE